MGKYYTYYHFHPETSELVYVGKGCAGRAWDMTRNRKGNPAHQKWMNELTDKGYLPCDWVEIDYKNLTEEQAFKRELELIHSHYPTKFNRQSGEKQHQSKLTNTQAIDIYKRVHNGEKPKKLAKEFKVSEAAIYHIKKKTQWKAVLAGVSI